MLINNFIAYMTNRFLRANKLNRKRDIYNKIPDMSRQNFQDLIKPMRTPSPFRWRSIRQALRMEREPFWQAAMDFHDPEDKE